ncbi:Trypsin [Metarhizium anisopliae]
MVPKAAIILAVAFSAVLAVAATIDKRIRGGEAAKPGEFPSIVRIHYNSTGYLCGGSLLDSTTVLTAAHCWFSAAKDDIEIVSNKDTGGVVAEVKSTVLYPEYKPRGNRNDIAILKLSTPILESETIAYTQLPATGSEPGARSTVVAAGWGVTEDKVESDELLKVALIIKAPKECLLPNDNDPEHTNYLDTKVCAGDTGKDTGEGDSGGPLFEQNQETKILIGLTSFTTGSPAGGFYTKVSRYITWINNNLGDVETPPSEVMG